MNLRSYQTEASSIAARTNALVIHPVGAGKTATGVDAAKQILNRAVTGLVLVVCKKSARQQWVSTINTLDPSPSVHICDANNPTPNIRLDARTYVITHFEMLDKSEWLRDQEWLMVVCDEAHRIKNTAARRTKAIKKLDTQFKLALTGTPLHKSTVELFSVLQWLYPKKYRSKRHFFNNYVEMGTNMLGYPVVTGSKNLSALSAELAPFTHVRNNETLYPDMQQPLEEVVTIPMLPEQEHLYWSIYNTTDIYVDGYDTVVLNGLARLMKCQQISSYPALIDYAEIGSSKLEWLADFIEDLSEQAIVFTRFRQLAIDLNVAHANSGVVCGGIPYVEETIAKFKRGDLNLLFGTIDGMGESLDFPNVHTCVFIDCDPKTISMQQAMGRINRPASGVLAAKKYYFLQSSPTDVDVRRAYKNNLSNAQLITNTLQTHENLKGLSQIAKV